jgi:hypothetical protein
VHRTCLQKARRSCAVTLTHVWKSWQGLVRSVEEQNPEEFVYGVARGGTSLLRHTLGGVANSASCITDNLSKQMSNLAFDRVRLSTCDLCFHLYHICTHHTRRECSIAGVSRHAVVLCS